MGKPEVVFRITDEEGDSTAYGWMLGELGLESEKTLVRNCHG